MASAQGFTVNYSFGSLTAISDATGNRLQEINFDAWGNRCDPNTWCAFASTLDNVTNAAISDGRIKNPTLLNKLGFGKRGYYSVYLVSADGVDYHWYSQDKGGMWSHKPGITPVVNVDASGRFISNPVRANHGIYNNGGTLLWVKRR